LTSRVDTNYSNLEDARVRLFDLEKEVDTLNENVGKSIDMPIVIHSYNEQEVEITPNVYHKWNGSVSLLTITFSNASSDYVQNYLFEFKTSSNGCELTLPTDLKWVNGNPPAIKANVFYQISVVNNLGVWSCYE
jgi:hypothetical protein